MLLAALALLALGAWSAPALGAVSVTVEPARGEPETISTDEIVQPDIDTTYTVRQRSGAESRVKVENGISIRQLLEATKTEISYGTVEITRPNGSTLVLSRDQIDASQPPPPVLYTDASGVTRFLRSPWDSDDSNAGDSFEVSGTLVLRQQKRSALDVTVTASPKKIEEGESVTFEASASGGPTGASYIFRWDFRDDGPTKQGSEREVTHKFDKRGEYQVLVTASIPGSERSDPAVVEVTVGEPEDSDKDRSGGGTNTTGGADSGASDGSSGGGSTYGGSTYGGGTSAPTYTPPPPAPYTPPAPPPSTTPEPPPPGIATDGSFVEGNLLADASDPPSGSILESAARAARDGRQRDNDDSGGGAPEAALSVAAALALLGLGAGLESRQGRPLRLRLPRRAA